ncbi:MAG: CGNR zinc finger domain-containing protein [Nocardioidaceae bacterium]
MIFAHDTEHSLLCLVALINTDSDDRDQDGLPDVPALHDFVRQWDVSDIGALDDTDLAAVRALRLAFRAVFDEGSVADAAERVNAMFAGAKMCPRLTHHDGYSWHMHYFAPNATLAEHLRIDGGVALAQVVAAGEQDRLQVCDAPDCSSVLVDLSRNRSKRYCDSRTCGNRLHVAAYRERRRAEAAG